MLTAIYEQKKPVVSATDRFIPLLSEFQHASKELLDQRVLTSRIDWNFVLPVERLAPLLADMKQSHALLTAGNALVGRYRSRYYDSQTMRCYHDHRRRVRHRFKLRHRHYLDRSLTMFEIKAKTPRGDTLKRRIEVPFIGHGGTLDSVCRKVARDFLGVSVDGFAPTLDNQFNRITLLAFAAEERVTIDLDLALSMNGQSVELPGLAIIEIKSASARHLTPTLLRLAKAGLRPQGLSKYIAGISLLNSEILPSWFAPMRRRISTLSEPVYTTGPVLCQN